MNLHPDQFGEQLQLFDPGPAEPVISPEQKDRLLMDVRAANSPTVIRAPSDAAVSIVEGDKFLSQHDTGTSRGNYDPRYRRDFEDRFFGTLGEDREHHPIYGYQMSPDFDDRTSMYGDTQFFLKNWPQIRDKTTMTKGDSLGAPSRVRPAYLDQVPWRARDAGENTPDYAISSYGHETGPSSFDYYEAQVHTPLFPSRDVDRIHIEAGNRPSGTLSKDQTAVVHAAEKAGIPWSASVEKSIFQPTLIPQDVSTENGSSHLSPHRSEAQDWRDRHWRSANPSFNQGEHLGSERVPLRREDIPGL